MAQATASESAEGTEISPRWEAALLAFARDQDRRGVAAATKRAYGADLARACGVVDRARGTEPDELRYRDLRAFAAMLSGRGLAKSSIGRKLAAVRSFFDGIAEGRGDRVEPGRAAADAEARAAAAPSSRSRPGGGAARPDPGAHPARDPRPRDVRTGLLVRPARRGDREPRHGVDRLRGRAGTRPREGIEGAAGARSASRRRRRFADTSRPPATRSPSAATQQALFLSRTGRRLSTSDVRRRLQKWVSELAVAGRDLAARAPSFVRHAPARGRRRPALDPGAARPLQRLDDSGLHAGRALAACDGSTSARIPAREVAGWLTFPSSGDA